MNRCSSRSPLFFALSATVALAVASIAAGQDLSELPVPAGGNGVSQKAEVSQWIGLVKVTIGYHSPAVHDRTGTDRAGHVWGELVPYGFSDEGFGPSHAAPWRAGANETTTFTVSHDVKVGGKELRAGSYGLLLAIAREGPWTWIFSRRSVGWGGYQYDPSDDVLRVDAVPTPAPYTEYLTYGFDDRHEGSAAAFLQWESKRVSLPIEVPNVDELYIEKMREDLRAWPGFNYQNWQQAAQYCADHKINLDEALVWAEKAISEPFRGAAMGVEDFSTLRTKASVLEALGRSGDADAVMKRALAMSGAEPFPVYAYGASLLAAGRKDKALEIFRWNQKAHPDEPYWTYLGLARGFKAVGDKKNAIRNFETVRANTPQARKANLPAIEQALNELRAGT